MPKLSKLNSITQINQDEIRCVVGAGYADIVLYAIIASAGLIATTATVTYKCAMASFKKVHPVLRMIHREEPRLPYYNDRKEY